MESVVRKLPPGFRFDPTDEDLLLHFLNSKFLSNSHHHHHYNLIPVFHHFYLNHPILLLGGGEAFESYGKWYFYTEKTESRVAENGYWREIGMDHPIYAASDNNKLVGVKKCLVYYEGQFPFGVQTNWFLHEFHLLPTSHAFQTQKRRKKTRFPQNEMKELVVCRAQQSNWDEMLKKFNQENDQSMEVELSFIDEVFVSHEFDDITSS